MKYSFLIPFYNRPTLRDTLESYHKWYGNRNDWEVIIVDAYYSHPSFSIVMDFENIINIKRYENTDKTKSCCVCYNQAALNANGDYFIITNPESPHEVNILTGLDEEFNYLDRYVVCACKSIHEDGSFYMWYQHSKYNPRMLHFCSAISKKNWWKINGFCEAYQKGLVYEDDDWLKRIKYLNIPIIQRDDLIVNHIEHERNYLNIEDEHRNRNLYNFIWDENRR